VIPVVTPVSVTVSADPPEALAEPPPPPPTASIVALVAPEGTAKEFHAPHEAEAAVTTSRLVAPAGVDATSSGMRESAPTLRLEARKTSNIRFRPPRHWRKPIAIDFFAKTEKRFIIRKIEERVRAVFIEHLRGELGRQESGPHSRQP
jgi:hypothetical protein